MRLATCVCLAVIAAGALGPARAALPAKADEGFAGMLLMDADNAIPRNRITRARAGDNVVYFIKWKEPVPRSSLRCVITGPDTNIDETEDFQTDEPNGFSVCPMETEVTDDGDYTFVQYLDGEKVGESSITLDKVGFLDGLTRRRQGKWILLGLTGLVVSSIYLVRRKVTGDTRSFKQLVRGESGAERAVAIAVATKGAASGLEPRPVRAAPAPPAPQPADMLADFKRRLVVDAAHRPASAEEAWAIARAARQAGDTASAVAALRGFDKAFPGHALIPEIYLFSAQMMAQDLGNPATARRIAQHILQKYPGHFAAPEAKRLLESLPA